MEFQFDEERQIEQWLSPFTSSALLPGYKRKFITETRLFWDTYWQLLESGYTENQIADYALNWVVGDHKLPYELALGVAIMRLGLSNKINRSSAFYPYKKGQHPRFRQTAGRSVDT